MWIADNWNDSEVLDASGGEKLERWGDYILIRPDPQVIWSTPRSHPGWKNRNGHYHRSAKAAGSGSSSGSPTSGAFPMPFGEPPGGRIPPGSGAPGTA